MIFFVVVLALRFIVRQSIEIGYQNLRDRVGQDRVGSGKVG